MVLKKMDIKGLYNCYDYHVKFNEDLTFIYGGNGCGKTTILMILSAIVSGKFRMLLNYEFNSIRLLYSIERDKIEELSLKRVDENGLKLKFRGKERMIGDTSNIETKVLESHIKKMFNSVNLPLHRIDKEVLLKEPIHKGMRRDISIIEGFDNKYALKNVEKLVSNEYVKIIRSINDANNNFRDKIISSLCEIEFNLEDNTKIQINAQDVTKTKIKIKKAFKELDILTKEQEEKIDTFYSNINNNDNDLFQRGYITHLVKQQNKIIQLVDELEEVKNKAYAPIKKFEDIIKKFFDAESGLQDKSIKINAEGEIEVTIEDKTIGLNKLSSGEKQIIILFANLIFGLTMRKEGIFIADEPELSLHLKWQKIFVDSIRSVSENIQLIFATHSPEIVNKNRDKMFKLLPVKTQRKDRVNRDLDELFKWIEGINIEDIELEDIELEELNIQEQIIVEI